MEETAAGDPDGGTYTLLIRLSGAARVTFGARGERALEGGWYAYVGSALGPGGFARIDRHRDLAAGERGTRHWHIDYLLGQPNATIEGVVRSPGAATECAVATVLRRNHTPVAGIGASDCECATHLVHASDRESLERAVRRAHDRASGDT